jgi:NADH-quinone oxidoreductase subunit G|uniref:NADH dehydrogenase (Quinone) subunit G n=1 Tax=Desulfobacca acetoxidans TaxID=60893 RepID=A0A7V6A5M1_9BACT
MPKLIIDQRPIEVPEGTRVIDAAERLGIMIPRFCYHPGLGAVGACRMCAVKFVEGPVKGIEMSCMTIAADGMVVSTTDPEAVEFRRYVIEWLMLNHPHDCPVCDEGGHCLLQDETVSGGHGVRRYLGLKRTYEDQYLGEFVQHEMNRCIHCWRCRRFYQEFAGYYDYGAMQIGSRMYFGRFESGPLTSPFSGNIIDLCPTGVLTDKPARYKGRRWDFERGPSLCLHCSLGCNIVGNARYREMVRVEGRFNEAVNGYFICDRGRFGFAYANHPERPRAARVMDKETPLAEAVRMAAARLGQISARYGAAALAAWGSPRSSLETQGVLTWLCRRQGWAGPQFFLDAGLRRKVKTAVSRLDGRLAVSLRDIEKADFIVVAGADPLNEAPMLALALRQAWRRGAAVVVLDPRPVFLPFDFEHLPLPPEGIKLCLNLLVRAALSQEAAEGRLEPDAASFYNLLTCEYPPDPELQDRLVALGMKLKDCRNPVIVCNTEMVEESTPGLAADHTRLLKEVKGEGGLFYLLPGPNAFGAALLAGEADEDPLAALENGTVKALLVAEADPFWSYPDRERLVRALDKLELLVVLDYLPTATAARAHVFLPTVTVFEKEASHYVNQEGRLQQARPLYQGGTPIRQVGAGDHPPRIFLNVIPGGEPRSGATLLADLGEAMTAAPRPAAGDFWEWLAPEHEVFARIASLSEAERAAGVRLVPPKDQQGAFTAEPTVAAAQPFPGKMKLLLVDQTYGTEELSGYSAPIHKVEENPCLMLPETLAQELGLAAGDQVALSLPGGEVRVGLKTSPRMAPQVAILPRHRRLAWQKVPGGATWIGLDSIKKVGS